MEQLFSAQGHSLTAYPLRAVWMETDRNEPLSVLVSVSKRRLHHAVDRNRTKRLVREAYRQNKHLLLDKLEGRHLCVAFLWLPSDTQDFATVQAKMQNLLMRIGEALTMDGGPRKE